MKHISHMFPQTWGVVLASPKRSALLQTQVNKTTSDEVFDFGNPDLFAAHVAQVQLTYHFNKRAFFRSVLQYMDITRNRELYLNPSMVPPQFKWLFSQFLFSYKLNPRTVLFLGYSDNHIGSLDINITQSDRTFFLKIGYALSL